MNLVDILSSHVGLIVAGVAVLLALLLHRLVLRLFGMIVVPEDSVGIVTKTFVLFGEHKSLPDGSVVALNGEAGVQADTLATVTYHCVLWGERPVWVSSAEAELKPC